MNLKYVKISVYIMTTLLALGIPLLIFGLARTSDAPDSPTDTNSSIVDSLDSTRSSSVINLEKFGDIDIKSGDGFTCDKPQITDRIILLYCTNNVTHKKKIISIDLYNGATLGTINY